MMQSPPNGSTGFGRMTAPKYPDIFYRYWHANGPATILLMHGLGAHSGWFIDMGNSIAQLGMNVYAMDHQGYGRSGGPRGHITDWRLYLADIDRMIDLIKRDLPQAPLFILGHSMGGVFAIQYTAAHGDKLRGTVVLNPWIEDTAEVSLPRVISIFAGGMLGSRQRVVFEDVRNTKSMTTNPEAVRFLVDDPFWVDVRTKGFYYQITMMRSRTMACVRQITTPILMIQAERDLAVVPAATRRAFDALITKDKTYLALPNYEHDSEFEIDRTVLDTSIVTWMRQRVNP
jgi:alpha-beta hydrolase superfamily lysophospholipase